VCNEKSTFRDKKMIKLLAKPYPFYFTLMRVLSLAITIGIFIGLVFYAFSDQNFSRYVFLSKTQRSFFYALITFCSIVLVFGIFPKFYFSKTQKENWTVLKQINLILLLHLTVVIFNFSFILLISKNITYLFSFKLFLILIVSVLLLGFVPSTIVVWIDYTLKLKQNLKKSQFYNEKLKEIIEKNENLEGPINILSKSKNEIINISLNNLLFIRAEGNYVEVYTKKDKQIIKNLYRVSIETIENELKKFPYIIRTHRSYIVNIRNIEHSKGTARNYLLFFSNINESIPVSRNRFKDFNKAILH